MPSQATINTVLITLFGSILTWLCTAYWHRRTAVEQEAARLRARVEDLELQLALVKQSVLPISTAFQTLLIKELTHYHTEEMDALLVKIGPPNILTPEEIVRLHVMLIERTQDMHELISDSERDAAAIFPIVMKRAKAEAALPPDAPVQIQLVTVVHEPGK